MFSVIIISYQLIQTIGMVMRTVWICMRMEDGTTECALTGSNMSVNGMLVSEQYLPTRLLEDVILSVWCVLIWFMSVCLFWWVYSGHIIHHYNGIWGTCAPGRRNMHQEGAICTTVHKGEYVFWKIQGTLMILCFGGSLKTHTKFVRLESVRVDHMYLNGSHGWFIGSQVFERVTLLQLFLGSLWIFVPTCIWMGHMVDL